ncbi:MAG: cellulase family glycosylhydrolase [Candidatus Sumerlaeota bacterium]|nr:cellulase family glycosylhydrolase [Candidatus Sumerlaeota bacterium]
MHIGVMHIGTLHIGVMLALAGVTLLGQVRAMDIFEQNRLLGRGVNIIGYDPIWKGREQAQFQEKHFRLLKEAGFNNVRVNLHSFRHIKREQKWALPQAWWDTLDWVVKQATQQGLRAILDCHEFMSMAEDPEGNHERFLSFWEQMSAHFKDAPDSVLFEILNEPNKKMTPELWNRYMGEALALIRANNPQRAVIVGPAFWNSIDHLGVCRRTRFSKVSPTNSQPSSNCPSRIAI